MNLLKFPQRPVKLYTILVIDDEISISKDLAEYIKITDYRRKYSITSVIDPRDTYSTISSLRPDIVLLDYAMPYIGGIEVMREIDKLPPYIKPPVIFLTEFSSYRNDAMSAGAWDYLVKSENDPESIIKRIDTLFLATNPSKGVTGKVIDLFIDRIREEVDTLTLETFVTSMDKQRHCNIVTSFCINIEQDTPVQNKLKDTLDNILWIDRFTLKSLTALQDEEISKIGDTMLFPVAVDNKGNGVWSVFCFSCEVPESQKETMEHILPLFTMRWAELIKNQIIENNINIGYAEKLKCIRDENIKLLTMVDNDECTNTVHKESIDNVKYFSLF